MTNKKIIDLVIEAVSKITNLSRKQILYRSRAKDRVNARRILIYILRCQHQMGWSEIGRLLKCNHATVIYHYDYVINNHMYDPDVKRLKFIVDGTTSKERDLIKKSLYKILDDKYKSLDDKLNILIDVLKNEKGNISQYDKLRLESYTLQQRSKKASKDVEKINIHDLHDWKDS
jgi:hypothetical protein